MLGFGEMTDCICDCCLGKEKWLFKFVNNIFIILDYSVLYYIILCDVLCYVIDNTDAGALESLDEIIKKLIPTIIDKLILVEKGELKINKKSTKNWCCF